MLTFATDADYQMDIPLHHSYHPMDSLLFAAGADRIYLITN
jgi:hypothetical protein